MDVDAGTLGLWMSVMAVMALVVSAITWRIARGKIDSPRLLAGCSLALGLFPPLNLLLLSLLALLPDRNRP